MDKKPNKIITSGSIAALSLMLGITSLTGCARSEKFNEISSIYSFGNTYLSDEKKKSIHFPEKI